MLQISPALAAVMEDAEAKLAAETLLDEEYAAALYLFDRIVNAEAKTSADTDMRSYLLQTWREVYAAVSSRTREAMEADELAIAQFQLSEGIRLFPVRRRTIG